MNANSGKVQVNSVAVRDYIQTQLAALQTLSAGILGANETNKLFGKNGKKNGVNAPVAALPNMNALSSLASGANVTLPNMGALASGANVTLPNMGVTKGPNGRGSNVRNNAALPGNVAGAGAALPGNGANGAGAALPGNGANGAGAAGNGSNAAKEPLVEGTGEEDQAGGARRRRKKSVKGKKRRSVRKH